MPRLIDLSVKLCADPLMKLFHVRPFETSDQRRGGFLARQRQRDAAQDRSLTPDKLEIPRAAPIDIADSPMETRQETTVLFNSVEPSPIDTSYVVLQTPTFTSSITVDAYMYSVHIRCM